MSSHSSPGHELPIWDRPAPAPRPGRPPAAPEQITAAAFAIADREGLHAVSVKRVAGRLKINAVVLNGYLSDRDDLLDLMLDAALGEIALPEAGGDWRADLHTIAHAVQAVAARHPWLRELAGTRTPSGPNGLAVNERILAALAGLGLRPPQMLALANAVLAFVYGFVQLEMAPRTTGVADSRRRARDARRLAGVVTGGDYPQLAALFDDPAEVSAAGAFETGLQVVLDGIAAHIEQLVPA